jgi:coenzyme F420-reducing hydrogenase beta subunit
MASNDKNVNLISTRVYAGRVKDYDALMCSSSGGAFKVISDYFLLNGCAIVCAVYDYDIHETRFKLITSEASRDAARGSKYMQSKPGEIFKESVAWLKQNPEKSLLFVGMGCQAEGFRKFEEVKGLRDRVYIVDIICHGSPSPKLWREYAALIENKNHGKISYLSFKDKRNGWNAPTAFVQINGEEMPIKDYVRIFYNCCALRPSCHVCPFVTTERKTDLTIGDFWHIEESIPDFYDKNGTSIFLIHTDRGAELFERIKDDLDYRESNVKQCWQTNLEKPTPISEHRVEFWRDYNNKGINHIMKKYGTTPIMTRVKNKVRKIRGGTH